MELPSTRQYLCQQDKTDQAINFKKKQGMTIIPDRHALLVLLTWRRGFSPAG
jgi:hypothetical protein